MLTLEQAIEHCHEKAKELRKQATIGLDSMTDTVRVEECKECAAEHEQLADWLEELTERREVVNRLEEVAKDYKDSLFGDGIRFALKIIGEPRKRDWESEATNE